MALVLWQRLMYFPDELTAPRIANNLAVFVRALVKTAFNLVIAIRKSEKLRSWPKFCKPIGFPTRVANAMEASGGIPLKELTLVRKRSNDYRPNREKEDEH
jgi:hypothetical protein